MGVKPILLFRSEAPSADAILQATNSGVMVGVHREEVMEVGK